MRKSFIVIISLVIAATYSAIKLSLVSAPHVAMIITNPVDDSLQANEPSAFEQIPILNIKVGGYTPPAPSADPEMEDIHRRVRESNRQWSVEDEQKVQAGFKARAPQRLGDVIKAGFIENNAGYNLYQWIDRQISQEVETGFRMRDHKELFEDIPGDMIHQFRGAASRKDAERIRADILEHLGAEKRLSDAGVVGTGAAWVVGMFDVDSLVIVLLAWYGLLNLQKCVRAVRAREKSALDSA